MSNEELTFSTVSDDELAKVKMKNAYQEGSIKGKIFEKLSNFDKKSKPLAISYSKDGRDTYIKSIVYKFNSNHVDKRTGKLSTITDKENKRVIVFFDNN